MDGGKYNGRRTDENIRALNSDLEEFNGMRIQITDMVSNKFFNNGIITPEDRELLRNLLREIKDIIHDIETAPDKSFAVVSRQNISERTVHTRDKFRNVMYAFDNNKSIASVLKEEGPYRKSVFESSDSLETDDAFVHSTDNVNTQFKINYGFENDKSHVEYGGKDKKNSANRTNNAKKDESEPKESKNISPTSTDKEILPNPSAEYNRHDGGFYGTTGYFLDDFEVTSTISMASDDNWTFRKPISMSNTAYEDNELQKDPKDDVIQQSDENGNAVKDRYRLNSETKKIKHSNDDEDYLYDDTVVAVTSSEDNIGNDKEVDEALGDFDYLDEYHSHTSSSNVSQCGSDSYLESVGKGQVRKDYNEKGGNSVVNEHNINKLDEIPSVKDVLGVFDYLKDYHSRTNSTSTASLYGSEDNLDLDDKQLLYLNDEANKSTISDYENMLGRTHDEAEHDREETKRDYVNVKRRLSNEEQLELKGYNRVPYSALEPSITNALEQPVRLHRDKDKSYRHMNYDDDDFEEQTVPDEKFYRNTNYGYDDFEEHSPPEGKFYRHMTYGIEGTKMQTASDINTIYAYDNVIDMHGSSKVLVGRTRSEEVLPSFSHGEFILRRSKSEEMQNQTGAFRKKTKTQLEDLPEDTRSIVTEIGSIGNEGKSKADTNIFDICGFLMKVVMFILFGIGVAEIILGIVLRKACDVEEIVPICTMTSGGVSICYCIIFIGIDVYTKRKSKTSRSFRTFLVLLWLILLGLLIAGGVFLYPSIKEHAFRECQDDDCCRRKLILITFGAIIIDLICQLCFIIGICCV